MCNDSPLMHVSREGTPGTPRASGCGELGEGISRWELVLLRREGSAPTRHIPPAFPVTGLALSPFRKNE